MRKLIWWQDFTTEAQDEVINNLEDDSDDLKDILQTVAESAYATGYKEALADLKGNE